MRYFEFERRQEFGADAYQFEPLRSESGISSQGDSSGVEGYVEDEREETVAEGEEGAGQRQRRRRGQRRDRNRLNPHCLESINW